MADTPTLSADDLARALGEGLDELQHLVSGPWEPPKLRPRVLSETTTRLDAPQAVRQVLADFASRSGCIGWMETPQKLVRIGSGAPPLAEDGIPLHAELACGRSSLMLRWADGAWCLTEQTESPSGATPTGATACWSSDCVRQSALPGQPDWRYRVYSRVEDDGRLTPFSARLLANDDS